MSVHGDKDVLFQLPGALLRSAHRARIRSVMRYSGPRMLFHHPLLAIAHVIETKKEQRRMRREENK